MHTEKVRAGEWPARQTFVNMKPRGELWLHEAHVEHAFGAHTGGVHSLQHGAQVFVRVVLGRRSLTDHRRVAAPAHTTGHVRMK